MSGCAVHVRVAGCGKGDLSACMPVCSFRRKLRRTGIFELLRRHSESSDCLTPPFREAYIQVRPDWHGGMLGTVHTDMCKEADV